ncbi:MAG: DUF1549 and DUF1553 domain-containing protein [Chthoniobacteraceae bacterium]
MIRLLILALTLACPLMAADVSFRNHVQPILAKSGCSSGACHGAAAGQGGFKLSLRGYDDEGDYLSLTRGAFGRRINLVEPARSLQLMKATAAVPHKGGERFKIDSPEWRTIAEWLANGAQGPKADDVRIERIELLPSASRLKAGDTRQLSVKAYFSDGHTEDVTRYAKYTATDQAVANVDDFGKATVVGHGESAITAWYLQKITFATVTAPFENQLDPSVFAGAPTRNWIDGLVSRKLESLNLPPSPRCSDGEFLRRAFLDTIGVLPTARETAEFLADASSGKRDRIIEQLLSRPEFVDYWSYKWSDLFLVTKRKLPLPAVWAYYKWIRDQVATNTPWDEFARRLLTAQGSTLENGAANYFVMTADPRDLSEKTAVTFLGISTNCARCHNHPMEKWTNNDYFGYANLFSRVRFKNGPGGEGDKALFAADDGDLVQPLTGRPQTPRPLGGKPLAPGAAVDRREALVEWLTAPENPYFARAIVNRVWANFLGVGLVEAVDDIRETNPASNEELFSAAAQWLRDHRYDLRAFMREILQSETYQRSSVPLPGNKADTRFYSRYYPRRLMAEVLHDAVAQVTQVPTMFKTKNPYDQGDKGDSFPAGWRAVQLPDVNSDSYFTRVFGRPLREQTCTCERTAEPNVTQALHLANGDTINAKLRDASGVVAKTAASGKPLEKWLDDAYLAALGRAPTTAEREAVSRAMAVDKGEQRAVMEDVYWALMSSREFIFNH